MRSASRVSAAKPHHLIDAALQLVGEGGAEAVSAWEAALGGAPASDPLERFRRLGLAYLRWAMRNPTHFVVISSRRLFDHDKSPASPATISS